MTNLKEPAMSKIVWDVSISLDGFTSGPGVDEQEPMGVGGEGLHEWMGVDVATRRALDESVGAALIGRTTFDLGLKPWGGTPWPGVPSFVITHRPRQDLVGDNGGTFAFDGLEAAAARAKEAAGEQHVIVLGATVGQALLRAGLIDELHIHLVPIMLGGGVPLFRGERVELIPQAGAVSDAVTHLRYRVRHP
jgi:dihydrofolate reductase